MCTSFCNFVSMHLYSNIWETSSTTDEQPRECDIGEAYISIEAHWNSNLNGHRTQLSRTVTGNLKQIDIHRGGGPTIPDQTVRFAGQPSRTWLHDP